MSLLSPKQAAAVLAINCFTSPNVETISKRWLPFKLLVRGIQNAWRPTRGTT